MCVVVVFPTPVGVFLQYAGLSATRLVFPTPVGVFHMQYFPFPP